MKKSKFKDFIYASIIDLKETEQISCDLAKRIADKITEEYWKDFGSEEIVRLTSKSYYNICLLIKSQEEDLDRFRNMVYHRNTQNVRQS